MIIILIMIPILYLHGFASSPRGMKVRLLRERLEPKGIEFHVPDLNVPSFARLDYASTVDFAIDAARAATPRVIVGSSLGSLIALEVARGGIHAPLVLIAPALGVAHRWKTQLPPGDPITVFNYAEECEMPIHRAFFDQVSQARPEKDPPPASVTILMGRNDESVPFERVAEVWRSWEESGRLAAGSRFIEIPQGDHSLTNFVDQIAAAVLAAV